MVNKSSNNTYTATTPSKEEIVENQISVLSSFGLLPKTIIVIYRLFMYWIPKLHKNPYKQRYITGSAKCSTKPLSTAVNEGLQSYHDTRYSRNGINSM